MDYTKIPMSILITRLAAECDPTDRVALMNEIDRRIPIPAAQPAPVSGWQPIESAPVGASVLIWGKGWGIPDIGWMANGRWTTSTGIVERPTHWMPLPEVPR